MKHATARDSGPDAVPASPAGASAAQELIAPAPASRPPPTSPAWMPTARWSTRPNGTTRDSGRAWRARRWLGASRSPGAGRYPCALLRWFGDGRLNASFNCLDRHVASGLGERTAIVFEADDGAVTPISYRALLARASANWPTP